MSDNYRPDRQRPQSARGRTDDRGARPRRVEGTPSRFGDVDQPRRQPRPEPRSGARAPQRPPRRSAPAAPAPRQWLPRRFWLDLVIGVAIILLGMMLQGLMAEGFPLAKSSAERKNTPAMVTEIHGGGPIRLNEIMTSNGGVVMDESGETPDWVEVANIGNRAVNLKGYALARSAKAGNVFIFPDLTLQAGECVLVMADSRLQAEPGRELHAPFRLSSDGDVLMLFNESDVAIDTVNIPALPQNTAYVRRDRSTWAADDRCTPGALNTEDNYRAMTTVSGASAVQIVEVVASTNRYGSDENSVSQDYVILRNTSGETVNLSGWYLSDNPKLLRLWKFPEGTTIAAGGTLVVHCSGANKVDNPAHLHTSFRLSSEGETITLSTADGQPVDSVTYDLLKTDTAYLRDSDNTWRVGTPTVP